MGLLAAVAGLMPIIVRMMFLMSIHPLLIMQLDDEAVYVRQTTKGLLAPLLAMHAVVTLSSLMMVVNNKLRSLVRRCLVMCLVVFNPCCWVNTNLKGRGLQASKSLGPAGASCNTSSFTAPFC